MSNSHLKVELSEEPAIASNVVTKQLSTQSSTSHGSTIDSNGHGGPSSGSGTNQDIQASFTVPRNAERLHRFLKRSRRGLQNDNLNENLDPRASATAAQETRSSTETIKALRARILELERSERRVKAQLCSKREDFKDAQVAIADARGGMLDIEERLDETEGSLRAMRGEVDRYRGWWLNEYYSLKVLLQLVPKPNEVAAIAATSHARFMEYSSAGSN